ncbi:hypothetical protein ACPSL3_19135 [Vibrio owensii]|uniref:hypothetical protein n=1 Tax=Vibrio owensii TaxID=696485 RepID=UPI003AAFEF5A
MKKIILTSLISATLFGCGGSSGGSTPPQITPDPEIPPVVDPDPESSKATRLLGINIGLADTLVRVGDQTQAFTNGANTGIKARYGNNEGEEVDPGFNVCVQDPSTYDPTLNQVIALQENWSLMNIDYTLVSPNCEFSLNWGWFVVKHDGTLIYDVTDFMSDFIGGSHNFEGVIDARLEGFNPNGKPIIVASSADFTQISGTGAVVDFPDTAQGETELKIETYTDWCNDGTVAPTTILKDETKITRGSCAGFDDWSLVLKDKSDTAYRPVNLSNTNNYDVFVDSKRNFVAFDYSTFYEVNETTGDTTTKKLNSEGAFDEFQHANAGILGSILAVRGDYLISEMGTMYDYANNKFVKGSMDALFEAGLDGSQSTVERVEEKHIVGMINSSWSTPSKYVYRYNIHTQKLDTKTMSHPSMSFCGIENNWITAKGFTYCMRDFSKVNHYIQYDFDTGEETIIKSIPEVEANEVTVSFTPII